MAAAVTDTPLFEREERAFEQHKTELLNRFPGQYALIKDDAIIAVLPDRLAAIARGTQLFLNEPFYTKQIVKQEEPILLPSLVAVHES